MKDDRTAAVRIAGWTVDAPAHRLVREGEERRLEPRALQVLLVLARRPGAVVSRAELRQEVWGDSFVTDDAVSAAVIRLRRAFGDPARRPRVIETVSRSGYRLVADVRQGEPPPAHPDRRKDVAVRVGTVVHVRLDVVGALDDAEQWHRCQAQVDVGIRMAAEREGGWVSGSPGSAVAVFGAPRGREDHAARAVRCARAVVGEWDGTDLAGALLRVRCGAATGELLVGPGRTGGSGREVAGPAVQAARDLAWAGDPGEVRVTAQIAELLDPGAAEESGGSWRVTGQPASGSTFEGRQRRGLTPLAGRLPDLTVLELLAERAETGFGQVVVLVGEPGIGKSRLVHELIAQVKPRGWACAVGTTSSLDPHSPYVALRRLLIDAGSAPADDAAWAAVMRPDQVDGAWQALDPVLRQHRVAEMTVEALLADDRPHLLVVEDAHWADEATRAWLSQLADRIARRCCLLIVTTRVAQDEPWSDRSYGTRRRLGPLFPEDAAAMLTSLVGDGESLRSWKDEVLELASGTPLFLEECVRATAPVAGPGERGVLRTRVPTSVRGLLAERVDALSPAAWWLVERASVAGRVASDALLRELCGLDDAAFSAAADEAARSQILRPIGTSHGPGREFSHALLQEAAYAGLGVEARRAVHRALAGILFRRPGTATDAQVARHLSEGGEVGPAVEAWLRAARVAAEADAHQDALTHLDRARELLPGIPDPDLRDDCTLRVLLATGTVSVQVQGPTGDTTRAAFDSAVQLADRRGTAAQRFEARWGAWFVVLHSGDLESAARSADRLTALLAELEDPALVLEAHHAQWSGLLLLGRTGEGLAHARRGVALYQPELHHRLTHSYGGHDPGVCARNLASLSLWLQGEQEEARALAEDAVSLSDTLGHPYSRIEGCYAALTTAAVEGRVDDLERHLGTLDQLIAGGRVPEPTRGFADGFRGALAYWSGQIEVALAAMEPAAAVWQEFWGPWCLPLDAVRAQVLLAAGRVHAALAVLDGADRLAATNRSPWWDAELLRLRAVTAADDDASPEHVARLLRRAADAADRTGAVLLRTRVRRTGEDLAAPGETAAPAYPMH